MALHVLLVSRHAAATVGSGDAAILHRVPRELIATEAVFIPTSWGGAIVDIAKHL
jgi:hypothetical protein